MASSSNSYVCDTLPAPRLATGDSPMLNQEEDSDSEVNVEDHDHGAQETESGSPPPSQQPPARKLCVRHQRMADEGTNLKLQHVRLATSGYMCIC